MPEHHPSMFGRSWIEGYVEAQGVVSGPHYAYYCMNGPDVDGRWNIRDSAGNIAPGPSNSHPTYFVPDVGYSVSRDTVYPTRERAVAQARVYIADQRAYLARLEAALDSPDESV